MLDIFDVVFSLNSPSVDDVGDFFHRQNEEMRDIEIGQRIASFYNPENRGDDDSDACDNNGPGPDKPLSAD